MPEFKYWITGNALFIGISCCFACCVAVFAIREMIAQTNFRLLMLAAISIGLFGWWSAAEQEKKLAELRSRIVGADYCYVAGLLAPVSQGKVALQMFVPFNEPIFAVTISIREAPTSTDSGQDVLRKLSQTKTYQLGELRSGVTATDIYLPEGLYAIDIATRYKSFFERIKIKPFRGNLISLVDLYRFGSDQTLFQTPKPPGYSESTQ